MIGSSRARRRDLLWAAINEYVAICMNDPSGYGSPHKSDVKNRIEEIAFRYTQRTP